MRLLLDECVPARLKREFTSHEVFTIEGAGFKGLKNGALLKRASEENFRVLITVDKNIQYQQNISALPIAVILLSAGTNRIESLSPLIPDALEAIKNIKTGEIVIIKLRL
jgi:predicted nuclease of predicted toxin-antitoxin system